MTRRSGSRKSIVCSGRSSRIMGVLQFGELGERLGFRTLRQQHVGAVLHAQIPAPLSHAHRPRPCGFADRAGWPARRAGRRRPAARRRRRPAAIDRRRRRHLESVTMLPSRSTSANLPSCCQTAKGLRSVSCTTMRAGQTGARRWRILTQLIVSSARARVAHGEGQDRVAGVHAECGAHQRLRRFLRGPSITTCRTRRPSARGGVAHALGEAGAAAEQMHEAHGDQQRGHQHACRRGPGASAAAGAATAISTGQGGPASACAAAAGGLLHTRHAAFSTIQAQSWGKECRNARPVPAAARSGVRPGWVLTSSSTRRPGSPRVSS